MVSLSALNFSVKLYDLEFLLFIQYPIFENIDTICISSSAKKQPPELNCTPFVRQYVILNNKWGALLCQKEYRTRDILQNSKKLL